MSERTIGPARQEGPPNVVDEALGLVLGPAAADAPALDPRARARIQLVIRAQAGDRAAFDDLLDQWLEPAFRLALGIVGNEPDARDATQDAFVAAWRGLRSLRDPACFDGWLSRIVVNSCRGLRRTRRRSSVHEISVEAIDDALTPARPAGFDEATTELDALERAFDRLNVAERSILVLHHLEHRPLDLIAQALGIPVGTAKSRLFNARRALERALEQER